MGHIIGIDTRSDSEKQTLNYKGVKTAKNVKCGTCEHEYEGPYRFHVCPICKKIDSLYGKLTTPKDGVSDPEFDDYNGYVHV